MVVVMTMVCFHHMRGGEPCAPTRNRNSTSSRSSCVANNLESARVPRTVREELDGGCHRRCCACGEPRDVHDLQGYGLVSLDPRYQQEQQQQYYVPGTQVAAAEVVDNTE